MWLMVWGFDAKNSNLSVNTFYHKKYLIFFFKMELLKPCRPRDWKLCLQYGMHNKTPQNSFLKEKKIEVKFLIT